jgi:ABC-2 type transport system permease protein
LSTFAIYRHLAWAHIRGQMQYRTSFILSLLGLAAISCLDLLAIAIVLFKFDAIGGWSLPEVALLFGLTGLALGLADTLGRGFDAPFEVMMARGTFDTVLTRPIAAFVQVLASDIRLSRLGRPLQCLAVLAWALPQLPIAWNAANVLLLGLTVISGTLIYLGLWVAGATLCFWTVKQPEVVNVFTFGGSVLTSYPLHIYPDWLCRLYLYAVPVGFANYPAAVTLLGKAGPLALPAWLAWSAPLVGCAFFTLSLGIWRFGVRHYQGTGH